jgi:integrase
MPSKRFLLAAALKPATVKRYLQALSRFLDYCDSTGDDPLTVRELDDVVTEYIHVLYEESEGKKGRSNAQTLISALNFYCFGVRGRLRQASKALRGWYRLVPPVSYPPLTWDLCCAIAMKMVRDGYERYAVAILLQFDCLLRVSELVALRKTDIAFPGDPRVAAENGQVIVRLRSTKTGQDQSVAVEDREVATLLKRVLQSTLRPDGRLFPFRAQQYRKVLRQTCIRLGLSDRYVPHSCRHGGATRMFMRDNLNIEAIKVRGRWAATTSARRYIQQGVAMQLREAVPATVARAGACFARCLLFSFKMALSQKH